MRFFAGEILEDTVKAVAVGPQQSLVDMAPPPQAEHEVGAFHADFELLVAVACAPFVSFLPHFPPLPPWPPSTTC